MLRSKRMRELRAQVASLLAENEHLCTEIKMLHRALHGNLWKNAAEAYEMGDMGAEDRLIKQARGE